MDGAGNVYAAGVGTKPAAGAASPGLPPLPVTGAVGVTITFSQPGSANAATANTLIPEGSEIYRIAADGSPEKLVTLKDDVVYALAFHDGSLLAATGNRGRVYRVDTAVAGTVYGRDAPGGVAGDGVCGGRRSGLLVATSNSGKVYRMEDKPAATCDVYQRGVRCAGVLAVGAGGVDARGGEREFDLFVRSGNVESPLMGWSDWAQVTRLGEIAVPGGRFAQWKAVLRAGGSVESVGLNYLEKNLAPVVDEVVVQPDARVPANPPQPQNATVQVSFPAPAASAQRVSPRMRTRSR